MSRTRGTAARPRTATTHAQIDATFEQLVRSHTDVVWRFAMGMLRDAHEAEEVTQDTFVRVHRKLDTWRGDAALRTWIIAICRNLCIDRLRARRAEVISLDEVRAERAGREQATARGGDHAERTALRDLLARAAADLPDEEREAFHLVDVLGFSGTEAAEIVGVPPTTLRSRLYRAHDHLVAHVLQEEDDREL